MSNISNTLLKMDIIHRKDTILEHFLRTCVLVENGNESQILSTGSERSVA